MTARATMTSLATKAAHGDLTEAEQRELEDARAVIMRRRDVRAAESAGWDALRRQIAEDAAQLRAELEALVAEHGAEP